MLHSVASDLGLHCLRWSQKWEARHKWVKMELEILPVISECQQMNILLLYTVPLCTCSYWLRILAEKVRKIPLRAPSSEFVSSSIPSWQILTAHAQPFRGARDLAFCLKVPLDSLLVWASSEGSGETARMHRLAWTFAARIGDKYQIRLTRSTWKPPCMNISVILCYISSILFMNFKYKLLILYKRKLNRHTIVYFSTTNPKIEKQANVMLISLWCCLCHPVATLC